MKNLLFKTRVRILINFAIARYWNKDKRTFEQYLHWVKIQYIADSFPFMAYMGMTEKQIYNIRF